jgi:murein DD-endopeptidase MepM/ murein hydrolase activator NlpD
MLVGLAKDVFKFLKWVIPGVFIGLFAISMMQNNMISMLVPPGVGGGQIMPQGNGLPVVPVAVPTWDPTIPVPQGCPKKWPVHGPITQGPYGAGCSHQQMSDAIDIGVATGTQVVAAHDGIAVVGADSIYGNFVDIKGECSSKVIITRYAHLGTVSIGNNQKVTAGAPIGTVDNTGNSTGPHLHFDSRGDEISEFAAVYKTNTPEIFGCCQSCGKVDETDLQ